MTVEPAVYVDESGQEQIDYDNAVVYSGHHNSGEVFTSVQENQATGERLYEDDLIDDFTRDDYVDAEDQLVSGYFELFPQLPDALEWGADFYPPEVLDSYNKAVDEGDWDFMSPFIEQLIADYGEHGVAPISVQEQEQQVEEQQELTDEQKQEMFNEFYQEMDASTPDPEQAHIWEETSLEMSEVDPIFSDICYETAKFHKGETDFQESLERLTKRYTLEQMFPYYQRLMEGW